MQAAIAGPPSTFVRNLFIIHIHPKSSVTLQKSALRPSKLSKISMPAVIVGEALRPERSPPSLSCLSQKPGFLPGTPVVGVPESQTHNTVMSHKDSGNLTNQW